MSDLIFFFYLKMQQVLAIKITLEISLSNSGAVSAQDVLIISFWQLSQFAGNQQFFLLYMRSTL